MTLGAHRVGILRNLLAAVLYAVAAASALFGLALGWLAADSSMRNAATGDLAGSSLATVGVLGWFLPLALGAALLAMQVRAPAGRSPEGGRMGPDRRLLYRLDRMGRGPRGWLVAALAAAGLALVAMLVYLNCLPWLATTWSGPSRVTANAVRNWAEFNVAYLGPLMLLALACGSLGRRFVPRSPEAPGPPDTLC